MSVAALFLAYAGFTALAAAMTRHRREMRDVPVPPRGLRIGGGLLLACALAAGVAGSGWKLGPILWAGGIGLAALAVGLTLTYRAAWSWRLGVASGLLGVLTAGVSPLLG